MIAVISNSSREAAALADLTSSVGQPGYRCTSVRQFETLLRKAPPALVLTRLSVSDGYSDDVLSLLSKSRLLPGIAVIVLAGADCTPQQEARQLGLGADCVLRDPLRPEVLNQYVSKFLQSSRSADVSLLPSREFFFGGATVVSDQQLARVSRRSVHLSPKEIELARMLANSEDKMVTYEILYSELFGRAFPGESSNLRVLLGKLIRSFQALRVNLRPMIVVTPKSGYRYSAVNEKQRSR